MAIETSPFAPAQLPEMPAVRGVRLGTTSAGIKSGIPGGRDDLLLMEFSPHTAAAGVFTQSHTAAAPIHWCRALLPHQAARALVVNSGNANAYTGAAGTNAVARTAAGAAQLLHCTTQDIWVASTGVIGVPLPIERMEACLPRAFETLGENNWEPAARAIMTTDTFPKLATRSCEVDGKIVRINGIAKGSGMIAPNMATMLAFLCTDACIAAPVLQQMLARAVEISFNSITVDADTSTNDCLLTFATQQAANATITDIASPSAQIFLHNLTELCIELAQLIVRDGEGASRFVTIDITGAANERAARAIGLCIGNSPLVKTALAAGDANWGRIVAAAGRAGEVIDPLNLTLRIGGVVVTQHGGIHPEFREEMIAPHMQSREIHLALDVGVGSGKARIWTCDLTHGYIDINANYRT